MAKFDESGYYENHSSEQREVGLRLLELLDLKEGDKVLDLGCGTGYLTNVMAKRVGDKGMVSESKISVASSLRIHTQRTG